MGIIYKNGVQYGGTVDAANMHVDIGSSTLNLQTAIQNITGRVAPIESNPTTHAYAIGDLLVFNGMLYEATAAISSGDTLVIGTNIASTTVDDNKLGYNDICNNVITNDSTKVSSAAAAKLLNDKITNISNYLNFTLLSSSQYKATSTNFEDVGINYTIPSGKWALAKFEAWWSSGAPVGIKITNSSATPGGGNTLYYHEVTQGSDSSRGTPVLLLNGGYTYHMWVKRQSIPSTANNHVVYATPLS